MVTEQSNGHHGPTTFTFPDSGVTIKTRKVSPLLLAEIQKTLPPPTPPMQEVDYGGTKRMEPNPVHPDYVQALAAYRADFSNLIFRALVLIGVECEVDAEAVGKLRADMQQFGVTLPPEDKFVYVAHILCTSNEDVTALRDLLLRHSQPTEVAVAEATERFPAEVQGN